MHTVLMTLNGQLQEASAGYRNHAERAEQFKDERDALVRKALAKGWTHAQIAEATGLTRGRIGQLATEAREWRDKQTQKRSSK